MYLKIIITVLLLVLLLTGCADKRVDGMRCTKAEIYCRTDARIAEHNRKTAFENADFEIFVDGEIWYPALENCVESALDEYGMIRRASSSSTKSVESHFSFVVLCMGHHARNQGA